MTLLAGVDVGTTAARAVIIDEAGSLVADASADYPLATPRPGWSEQDPEDWWRGVQRSLSEAGDRAGGEIAAIGLTGQMHGSVFLDRSGEVIRPALLWNDQRTGRQCEAITDAIGAERLLELAGNPALTGFQAPKILWLRDEEPAAYERVAHVLLPKDYVRYRLTGELATDASDAAGTLLLDVQRREWSSEILGALQIDGAWLPEVHESPEVAGRVRAESSHELPVASAAPVVAGAGDNAAAAVGTAVVEPGRVSSSVGTSGVVFSHTPEFTPDSSGRVHAFCHAIPGAYHQMAVTLSAGGSFTWWRDLLGSDFDALTEEAADVGPGSEGLVFLPYLAGERTPHLDPRARGAFFGLNARHQRRHLTRAVMEGVVYSLRDGLEVMRGLGLEVSDIRATGGGSRSPLWRALQADIYRLPVRRTVVDEGPAYGAALLAGVGAGVFSDVAEACACVALRDEVTEPNEGRANLYDDYFGAYRDLYPATRETMSRLTDLAAREE